MRTMRKPLPALAEDDKHAVMRMAEVLWSAYAEVLQVGPWPILGAPAVSTAITNNRLSRSALGTPLHVAAWDEDPVPANTDASEVPLLSEDSSYFYFGNGDTSPIWVRTWPQPPVFVPTGDSDMAVGVEEGVIYVHDTRKFYRLKPGKATTIMVSTYATAADWEADPEIWTEAAAYIRLAAQQDQLGNMEQERGQARELERQKREEMARLWRAYL